MDDRELLELAARAAGIELLDFYGERYSARIIATNRLIGWNPLTDDGDALRLAVSLGMRLELGDDAMSKAWTPDGLQGYACDHGEDLHAATRRAIVNAAAAIAQEMTDAQG